MTAAAAASTFLGTRLNAPASAGGRFQARFGFGFGKNKKARKKSVPGTGERPLWFPGAKAPEWLDGTLIGDYGFDPFGLGKPAEYLQFDIDSLDQNLAKNQAGDVIGTRTETADVKSTPFQPYSEVFGLQRFRECELIHGRWAMLATLGALAVEALTGISWQDAGKVELVEGSSYLGQPLPFSITTLIWIEVLVVGYIEFQRSAELDPLKRLVPGRAVLRPPRTRGRPGEEGDPSAGRDQTRQPRHGGIPRVRPAGGRHRKGPPQQLGHPPQRPAAHHYFRHILVLRLIPQILKFSAVSHM
ncbi:hypothetical protein KSP40_PGU005239 [Platanthera guangdongensis]|uniref:Chlorophyll a-b binding protein, chloroplastic n=1 Tax=Platanthera guangdongensis TaxID=2320717 RepID=A0ABR2MVV3_9ASPA